MITGGVGSVISPPVISEPCEIWNTRQGQESVCQEHCKTTNQLSYAGA